jgi:hypothetical protein
MKGIPREITKYMTDEWEAKARAVLREAYHKEPEEVMTETRVTSALGALRMIFERMQKDQVNFEGSEEANMRSLLDGALDTGRDSSPMLNLVLCIALLHLRRLAS